MYYKLYYVYLYVQHSLDDRSPTVVHIQLYKILAELIVKCAEPGDATGPALPFWMHITTDADLLHHELDIIGWQRESRTRRTVEIGGVAGEIIIPYKGIVKPLAERIRSDSIAEPTGANGWVLNTPWIDSTAVGSDHEIGGSLDLVVGLRTESLARVGRNIRVRQIIEPHNARCQTRGRRSE